MAQSSGSKQKNTNDRRKMGKIPLFNPLSFPSPSVVIWIVVKVEDVEENGDPLNNCSAAVSTMGAERQPVPVRVPSSAAGGLRG